VRSIRIRVARRRALPVQRPLDVTARRRGEVIVVRWHTAAPARRQLFFVADAGRLRTLKIVAGRGRTRFAARLRPAGDARVRFVVVAATSMDSDAERHLVVRVR
jgi:hypothetical protein